VYRIYRAEGLAVRRRKRKRIAVGLRTVLPPPSRPNERWSMDFTLDTLASGRKFRTLNIVDDFSRECLAIEVDTSLGGTRVVRVPEGLIAQVRSARVIVLEPVSAPAMVAGANAIGRARASGVEGLSVDSRLDLRGCRRWHEQPSRFPRG
jgi:transposase InsO family protein